MCVSKLKPIMGQISKGSWVWVVFVAQMPQQTMLQVPAASVGDETS
jgi:hypothetical protein